MDANLTDLMIVGGILFAAFFVSFLVLIIVRRHLRSLASRTSTKIDDYILNIISGPLVAVVAALGTVFALNYWDSQFPGTLPLWVSSNLQNSYYATSILVITSIVSLIINNLITSRIKSIIEWNPERETTFKLLNRLIIIVVYVIGVAAAISVLFPGLAGSLGTLLFGAGFLGIVLGLAAQKVIGNWLSGINVNVTHPIRLGDSVVINGEFGTVEEISLRHTVIKTWDNRRLVIPNSVLDEQIIVNYTLKDEKKLFPVVLYVPFDTDISRAKQIMIEEAQKHPNVLPELSPIFQVLDFGEGAITLRLLFMAKDQGTAFGTGCDLRYAIKIRFDKEEIRLSCPTRYLTIEQNESISHSVSTH